MVTLNVHSEAQSTRIAFNDLSLDCLNFFIFTVVKDLGAEGSRNLVMT